ncbi:MAG TPA: hypothetical protein VGA89_03645 [Patescibacteria group bacterium]|jgi:hypothetical protein
MTATRSEIFDLPNLTKVVARDQRGGTFVLNRYPSQEEVNDFLLKVNEAISGPGGVSLEIRDEVGEVGDEALTMLMATVTLSVGTVSDGPGVFALGGYVH